MKEKGIDVMPEQNIPEIKGSLRDFMLKVPEPIYRCSGIKILGRRIKSVLFSTDASIIRNTNADAVIAVYPFTPQPVITQAVMVAADVPVFVGVGGGLTQGHRVVNLALHAEFQGAIGVVVNAPTRNETIKELHRTIDVPIVVTVLSEDEDIQGRIARAVAFERKGHFFTRRAPGYRVYCALWLRLRWCRQAIFHLRAVLPGNGRKGQPDRGTDHKH